MAVETELAWAAGIVDGEGCLYIARSRAASTKNVLRADNYHVALKVTMGHEPTILRLEAMFGSGSKHRVEQRTADRPWNTAYSWIVTSRKLASVLDQLYPYLFTKRQEADVAREFLLLPGWYGGQFRGPKSPEYQRQEYELWDRMRRLKPRTAIKLAQQEGTVGA